METVSVKNAREDMFEIINEVFYQNKIYELTRYGKPVGVIVSPEKWKEACRVMDRVKILD